MSEQRILPLILFLLIFTIAFRSQLPMTRPCLNELGQKEEFKNLAQKVELGDTQESSQKFWNNKQKANGDEKKWILLWDKYRKDCIAKGRDFREKNLKPQEVSLINEAYLQEESFVNDLLKGNLTFGEFAQRRTQVRAAMISAIKLGHLDKDLKKFENSKEVPQEEIIYERLKDTYEFLVDTHLMSEEKKRLLMPGLLAQLWTVKRVGLPVSILEFFKKIPIKIDPEMSDSGQEYGHYDPTGEKGFITVKDIELPREKPILLHNFLQAYHLKILGTESQPVHRALQKAKFIKDFPAHFLQDYREFFSLTAESFLMGTNCNILFNNMPEYVDFLRSLFGPHSCH